MQCPICRSHKTQFFKIIDKVSYFECSTCESLFADTDFISDIDSNTNSNYSDSYWNEEVSAARERSFGSSINRVAEVFLYSRIPISRFLDIGTGPGYLLDSLTHLMPRFKNIFYGVELYPPPEQYRTLHENYIIGHINDLSGTFSAGVCIEVIEHLPPEILRSMINDLSHISEEGALYYFNSAQPDFVKNEDPNYLDPNIRGHIVSYSIKALEPIFLEFGFRIIPLPGRSWGFLAEYSLNDKAPNGEQLLQRIWTAVPKNSMMLKDNDFGPLMHSIGIESARCYLEHSIANERTKWALSLINNNDQR